MLFEGKKQEGEEEQEEKDLVGGGDDPVPVLLCCVVKCRCCLRTNNSQFTIQSVGHSGCVGLGNREAQMGILFRFDTQEMDR